MGNIEKEIKILNIDVLNLIAKMVSPFILQELIVL